ncbi:MAG: hydroxyisourate hydrolase [Polyangiaceae bacterium]
MGISTHILDTTRGRPAEGVRVTLEAKVEDAWLKVGEGTTDADGRVKGLLVDSPAKGTYRITFFVAAYFEARQTEGFYPEVSISFLVAQEGQHFHVPLLLNPFGYSTYRGS